MIPSADGFHDNDVTSSWWSFNTLTTWGLDKSPTSMLPLLYLLNSEIYLKINEQFYYKFKYGSAFWAITKFNKYITLRGVVRTPVNI